MGMSASSGGDDGPMMEINTTPLIDVMLVLLIMLIITLPPPTHAVKIDLPTECPEPCLKPIVEPTKNVVYIAPDSNVLWNGQVVAQATLLDLLNQSKTMDPVPELHFQPDAGAPYETVHRVLKITKLAEVSKMGFIGNEAYRAF